MIEKVHQRAVSNQRHNTLCLTVGKSPQIRNSDIANLSPRYTQALAPSAKSTVMA
jgi:hypothetical protein